MIYPVFAYTSNLIMHTILIVEDEPSIRRFAALNLRARGYDVLEAASGEEALSEMRTHTPNMLLLDIWMPGMSGLDVLSEMSGDPTLARIPVVVFTAATNVEAIPREEYPNIADVLAKPVSAMRLVETVAHTLSLS
jgi:CheY-like chemotaxis protein